MCRASSSVLCSRERPESRHVFIICAWNISNLRKTNYHSLKFTVYPVPFVAGMRRRLCRNHAIDCDAALIVTYA